MATIPFHRAYRSGSEARWVTRSLEAPAWHSDGPMAAEAARLLAGGVGNGRVLLTPSCTAALELFALALQIGPGDEVIVPSFTFVSSASAFALRGARIVFADVEPKTLGLDPVDVERKLTPRTRAVLCVHYAGVPCDVLRLLELCRGGPLLIEDNAHGLFGALDGRALGSFGAAAAYSFHSTKNFSCGEGGALVVHDASLSPRAELLREKGVDRAAFVRGETPYYTWRDIGSSFLLSEHLAALLVAQLEAAEVVQARRRVLWTRYREALSPLEAQAGIDLPRAPAGSTVAAHNFWLMVRSEAERSALLGKLRAAGIDARFHYHALHLSDVGRALGGRPGDAPVSERAATTLVRLPLYPDLSDEEQDRVIDAVCQFFGASP